MNLFRFHAVGQGLFYTGSLANNTYRFVYDCGSSLRLSYAKREIDRYRASFSTDKNTKPSLDFIVISHLHSDHFNGLPYLLSHFNCKKIYLPYLGEDKALIRFLLLYEIFGRAERPQDVEENYDLFQLMSGLYRLEEGDDRIDWEMEVVFLGSPENAEDDPFLRSETIRLGGNPYWRFCFINNDISLQQLQDLADCIRMYLKEMGLPLSPKLSELVRSREHLSAISRIYRHVFGGNSINLTSTLLVHYPVYAAPHAWYVHDKRATDLGEDFIENYGWHTHFPFDYWYIENSFCHTSNPVSVLTGDATLTANVEKRIKAAAPLTRRETKYGFLQVPHHGAKDEWIALQNTSIKASTYIIPFGLGNTYEHPHSHVIDDMEMQKLDYSCVTQRKGFLYYIQ